MKLSPLDVQQHKFSVKFRGYDVEEVESFLEAVAQEVEEYIHKINGLNEELERKNERIWEYQNMEKTLKETLMIAQAASEELKHNAKIAAEDIRKHAQREADSTIDDAKRQAARILEEANIALARTLSELSTLKGKKIILEQELRGILETHVRLLDEHTEGPAELPDNEIPALNE